MGEIRWQDRRVSFFLTLNFSKSLFRKRNLWFVFEVLTFFPPLLSIFSIVENL